MYKSILHLALPIFIGQIALMANGVIDTVMAGRISAVDQAAVGIGMSVFFSVFVPLMGVLLAISPVISQHYGARDEAAVGEDVRQGFWLTLVIALLVFLLIYFPDPFLLISQLEPQVESKTRDYLHWAAFGSIAQMMFRLFYGFTTAISQPRIVMILSVFALAIKIPLNFVFMHGYFGFSAMGGVGCAMATTVAVWITIFVAAFIVWWNPDYKRFGIFSRWSWPVWPQQLQLWKLGLPMGLTFLVDVTSFTFMALFVARLGATTAAAHGIAINLAAAAYMLPMSISVAVSVLVGQAIGAGDTHAARRVGLTGYRVAALLALALAALIATSSAAISAFYTKDEAVRILAAQLLLLVAVYHVFDAMLAMGINALRGYKNAVVPMIVCGVCLWGVGLGGGYVLGLRGPAVFGFHNAQPLGAKGFWYAAITSFALASILVATYFNFISRQRRDNHPKATSL
jgi:multidrug resistance protein, MATE family